MSTAAESPIVNITGTLVALGPIRQELIQTYLRWINDFSMLRTLGQPPRPMTLEQEQAWYDDAAKSSSTYAFTIYERATWRPVGNTSLMDVDWRNRTAEFGILIGEPDARGKGFGTETASLMLDFAFTALGLHSVYLRVHEYNLAGRRAYEKAGFKVFGRRREVQQMGGRRWDTIYMDALASEFTSPVLAEVFVPDTPRS
jgi:RimJ/RimL family protein N-acetyltransferase